METVILNESGVPVQTTLDNTTTIAYAHNMTVYSATVKSAVRHIDPTDDLKYLRIRTRKNEVLVGTEPEFMLIAIQNISK